MYNSFYGEKRYREQLRIKFIGAGIMLMIILIVVLIVQLNERTNLYLEGTAKAIPLLRNDTLAELGNMYIEMENEFEAELDKIILGIANRKNKRGDNIYYGINGRDNKDLLKNQDYENGVIINYINSDSTKGNGESNFNDILAVISAIYGADADAHNDDVKEIFRYLFDISHTYKTESTELYACKSGCEEVLYYCGDSMIQGEYGGDVVGHYNTDLKYQPFRIKEHNLYNDLQKYYDDLTEGKPYEIEVGFEVFGYEGVCEIDSGGKTVFSESKKTTKNFAGCNLADNDCYHGNPLYESEDGERFLISEHCMGSSYDNCSNYEAVSKCSYSGDGDHDCHYGEVKTDKDDNVIYDENGKEIINIGCGGYYECNGHEHYDCNGHVLVCCFGHTTLNLDINILYYEAMLKEIEGKLE